MIDNYYTNLYNKESNTKKIQDLYKHKPKNAYLQDDYKPVDRNANQARTVGYGERYANLDDKRGSGTGSQFANNRYKANPNEIADAMNVLMKKNQYN